MVFSSLTFLFFFLPLALILYFSCPKKMKNLVLLAVSLFFYAWGEPIYILLMIFSATVDYFHGLLIHKYRIRRTGIAKAALVSSLLVNIGILSFFKYADFLVENVNAFFGSAIQPFDLPLPIGISFYTFQTMSYSIDVYRGKVQPQRNPLTLALYVSLFPQLIAGPIVRYETIEKELANRTFQLAQFADGVKLFIIGLGKKVLIANTIGELWFTIQQQDIDQLSTSTAWLGIVAFSFQIFFDFSGYSDMARGLGKMFGFNFPENFNYPYISKSVTEFWRRWHMTLGSWFRDYVYFPLGGSRKGTWTTIRNLLIVWGITGLWHGASWNFVLWGLYFGVLIGIEKLGWLSVLNKLPAIFQHVYLLTIVLFGWVLFVFEDHEQGLAFGKVLFGIADQPLYDTQFLYFLSTNGLLLLLAVIASTPLLKRMNERLSRILPAYLSASISISSFVIILFLSTAYLVNDSYNPFLYFRF
ncbi:MBOAT family O-acyltransferase [Sporosarcina saromensis]|uniref:MBOAT family O-acyltransferase n=1 Tax=Sporosarcina saromensis TaxID=359365 RepID=A0ABU4GBB3_9BACL|nr:MBOAT family O-acyltransferase [Sporosarcina saromensis]MDW0114289.1 MBOAT family O-acyltransferase [Sporosarcina saromensis]